MALKPSTPKPIDLSGFGLQPEFANKLTQLLVWCQAHGLDFRISQGLRTPEVQAKYYCQWAKRSPADIGKAAGTMKGAPWLQSILLGFRNTPRIPKWQTSQLPGSGWHQWGEAADCYCYRNGQMVKSGNDPCYKQYADAAKSFGLTPGFYFRKQDSGHVQLRNQAGATDVYKWSEIDATMKARFSDKPSI